MEIKILFNFLCWNKWNKILTEIYSKSRVFHLSACIALYEFDYFLLKVSEKY